MILRDFQILEGGWFGILATGVDNLLIDGVMIDTNRDGIDIDCCWNVRISNCSVNSPWDDAIVLKSSLALGRKRDCANITIANCYVTGGYKLGTLLDGSWQIWDSPKDAPRTGRIKIGTESNGAFHNIAITNCIFEKCEGLALESVDGSLLEDLVISNIVMREIVTAPLFLRLGSRLRGPSGTTVGAIRRVIFSNITSSHAVASYGCIISGIPGFAIEDLKIASIHLHHQGGGSKQQAAIIPSEEETRYPDSDMFGPMPSQGFFLRRVKGVEISDVKIRAEMPDYRPNFVLGDVNEAEFFRIKTPEQSGVPKFDMQSVTNVEIHRVSGLADTVIPAAECRVL